MCLRQRQEKKKKHQIMHLRYSKELSDHYVSAGFKEMEDNLRKDRKNFFYNRN